MSADDVEGCSKSSFNVELLVGVDEIDAASRTGEGAELAPSLALKPRKSSQLDGC